MWVSFPEAVSLIDADHEFERATTDIFDDFRDVRAHRANGDDLYPQANPLMGGMQ